MSRCLANSVDTLARDALRTVTMTNPESVALADCLTATAHIVASASEMQTIQHHLRLSRLQLGASIELLETSELPVEAAEEIRRTAELVAAEIESLLQSIREGLFNRVSTSRSVDPPAPHGTA